MDHIFEELRNILHFFFFLGVYERFYEKFPSVKNEILSPIHWVSRVCNSNLKYRFPPQVHLSWNPGIEKTIISLCILQSDPYLEARFLYGSPFFYEFGMNLPDDLFMNNLSP